MVYDEMLHAKIKLEYRNGKLKRSSNPGEDWIRKKEHRIVNEVLKREDGVPHGELSKIVGLNRKNLRPYMKRLIDRGLVTRRGSNGLYFPTTKTRRGISLTADILANSFLSNILDNDNIVRDVPSLNKDDNTGLGHALLGFSNILGGFIVYTLIQSMNPENKITQTSRNVIEKDLAVQAWLEDALSILLENILSRFKDNVFYYLESIDGDILPKASDSEIFDKAGKGYLKFFHKRPFFTLDQPIISELINCFSNLYPNLSLVLEKTRSELPKLLAREKKHIKHVAEKAKLQKTCTHKYDTIIKYSYDNHRFERCRKCDKTRIKIQ